MEENINEKQQENNNADHLNADNLNKETAENNKPDYKEFTVSLSSIDYEGPLSILFDMMKRSEKNIYEVSILEIIDQFVEYLKAQAALNLDSTGDFLVVASEFHLYKSKMLLPHDMDDDKFTDRLKFEIVEQMLEFQRYKMVSEELDKLQDVSDSIFERKDTERVKFFQNIDSAEDNEVAWKDITLYDLVYAFTKVQFVPETDLAVLSGMSNFHIDNAIDMIRIKLSESAFFPFIVLFKDGVTKRQLVTFFLAMLELVKEKEILLKQEMKFKEIYVFKRDESFMPKAEEDKSDDYEESSEESNNNSEEAPNNEEAVEESNENTENNSSEEINQNNENLDNQNQ